MKYNFETSHSRVGIEATKWDSMGPQGPDVVPLSVADMELISPPEIVEELKKTADFGMWGYTWWGERYGAAVQHWMKTRHDWEINPEWIVQTNGVVQGLYVAVRAFSQPGDGVLIQTPVYYPFGRAIVKNNRKIIENPLKLVNGRYEIDFEDFEEKVKQAKIFILCNPHNPVGRVWTEAELRRMGDICLANHVLVVSDEIHFDIIMPGHKHKVYATLGEKYANNCIVSSAASKTFSLAGLCVANAIIPNKDLREAFDAEVNVSGCYTYSVFGIRALEVGYMECAPWVDQLNEHIYGNFCYFKDFMAKHFPKVWVADLEGTYLCWFDCSCFGMPGAELEQFVQKEAKLFLDDGYIFGPAGDGFERINLACTREVLVNALDRFEKAFSKLNK
ncbi:MAG: MalY/PatB family protein [Pseudoflavonifractor sp.]